MNQNLANVLGLLEPSALRFCTAEQWEMVKADVLLAGSIEKASRTSQTVVEKARFGSRSEAGRYAANQRWQGQGKASAGGATGGATGGAMGGATAGGAVGNAPTEGGSGGAPNFSGRSEVNDPKFSTPEYKAHLKAMDLGDITSEIGRMYRNSGKKMPESARPYVSAMGALTSINDRYFQDSGKSVVAYAMSNLKFYGAMGKAIKAELNSRLKG